MTPWQAWQDKHPDTLALDVHGWATGFHLEDTAIVVDMGSDVVSYRIPDLRKVGVVNEVVGGVEVAVVIDPEDPARWAVFSRRLDDSVVILELTREGLVDTVSGTVFDPFIGRGVSGPMEDQMLDQLPAFTAFPDDYFTFYPDGRIWP